MAFQIASGIDLTSETYNLGEQSASFATIPWYTLALQIVISITTLFLSKLTLTKPTNNAISS